MLHWITIDKIQDFLVENDIVFYMDWENWKIEIDLKQDDIRFNNVLSKENILRALKESTEDQQKVFKWIK